MMVVLAKGLSRHKVLVYHESAGDLQVLLDGVAYREVRSKSCSNWSTYQDSVRHEME